MAYVSVDTENKLMSGDEIDEKAPDTLIMFRTASPRYRTAVLAFVMVALGLAAVFVFASGNTSGEAHTAASPGNIIELRCKDCSDDSDCDGKEVCNTVGCNSCVLPQKAGKRCTHMHPLSRVQRVWRRQSMISGF